MVKISAAGRGPVFNLEVEGPFHEYLAGGILVSNCDALRYAIAARARAARRGKKQVDPRALSSRLDAILKERRNVGHDILGSSW